MNIEHGEYFVIARGPRIYSFRSFFSFDETEPWQTKTETETAPVYDRSYLGLVFRALEICGSRIAASIVVTDAPSIWPVGKRMIFDTTDVDIWPVTKAFAQAAGMEEK